MKEDEVAYLAGVVDSIGQFRVKIKEDDSYKLGYEMAPRFKLNRSEPETVVFGMFEDYCHDQGVRYNYNDTGTTMEFYLTEPDNIHRFLEPMFPYIVQKHEVLSIFVDEILPAYAQGEHQSKQGFYEIVKAMNEMYREDPSIHNWKYETAKFSNKWRDEIET